MLRHRPDKIKRFLRDQAAATALEYAVVLGLILMATFVAIGLFGTRTGTLFDTVDSEIRAKTGP